VIFEEVEAGADSCLPTPGPLLIRSQISIKFHAGGCSVHWTWTKTIHDWRGRRRVWSTASVLQCVNCLADRPAADPQ